MLFRSESRIIVGRDLAGVRVRAVMTNDPWTLPASMTVADALAGPVLAHRCSAFPVVEAEGTVVGLVTLRDLRSVPADRRGEVMVAEVALPVAEVSRAEPEDLLLDVLRRSSVGGEPRLLVFGGGRLVGIVTPTDVTRAVQAFEASRA